MPKWLRIGLAALAAALLLVLVGPYLIPLPAQPDLAPEALAPADGRFLEAAGTRTFIQEAGPAAGPAVVLVHGFGGLTYSWRATVPALAAAGYRVLALDLPGFGLSDKRFTWDYTHPAQADFVAAVMTAVGIDRAVLVGHSLGGSVIAHVAQRHPERVAALVFVDGAVRTPDAARGGGVFGLPPLAGALAEFPPLQRWGQLALRVFVSRERMAALQLSAYALKDVVTPEVEEGYLKVLRIKDWDLALLGVVRDSGGNTLAEPLATITAPTLVVWGERDPWIPLEAGQALHAGLPQSQLAVIPAVGHLPMEEAPEAFNATVLAFLETLP